MFGIAQSIATDSSTLYHGQHEMFGIAQSIATDSSTLYHGQHEMFGIAQSIATDSSTLYHGQKSDILKRLTTTPKPTITAFRSSLTIDLSGVINAKAEMKYSPFLDFAQSLCKYILAIGKDFERFDILCDIYFEISLKEGCA